MVCTDFSGGICHEALLLTAASGSLRLFFKAHADPQEKTCSKAVPSCLLSPRHVFFMDSCHLDVRDGRLGSTALCVASCPEEQLRTLEEVQLFANNTGGCRGAPRAGPAPGGGPAVGSPVHTCWRQPALRAPLDLRGHVCSLSLGPHRPFLDPRDSSRLHTVGTRTGCCAGSPGRGTGPTVCVSPAPRVLPVCVQLESRQLHPESRCSLTVPQAPSASQVKAHTYPVCQQR